MKPSTLHRGAFTLHRLLKTHEELRALSGASLVLAVEALDTRESHRLALLLLSHMAHHGTDRNLPATELPERLLAASLEAESVTDAVTDGPACCAEELQAESSAPSLPLNPSYSPKKKKNKKEKSPTTAVTDAVTDGSACCAEDFQAEELQTEEPQTEEPLTSEEPQTSEAPLTSEKQSRTPRRRKRCASSYVSWTPEEFMKTARNCRGSEMDDETFKAFCLYWLQPNADGVCAFQEERRFSMVQRMNAWMRRGRQMRYEAEQRLERIYGPARKPAPEPPALEEVKRFALAEGLDLADAERFHQYHTAYGWTAKGRPITSWQAALHIWCKRGKNKTSNPQHHEPTQSNLPTPSARPANRTADPTAQFQQRVDDIFDEAINRNRNQHNPNYNHESNNQQQPDEQQANEQQPDEHPNDHENEHPDSNEQ